MDQDGRRVSTVSDSEDSHLASSSTSPEFNLAVGSNRLRSNTSATHFSSSSGGGDAPLCSASGHRQRSVYYSAGMKLRSHVNLQFGRKPDDAVHVRDSSTTAFEGLKLKSAALKAMKEKAVEAVARVTTTAMAEHIIEMTLPVSPDSPGEFVVYRLPKVIGDKQNPALGDPCQPNDVIYRRSLANLVDGRLKDIGRKDVVNFRYIPQGTSAHIGLPSSLKLKPKAVELSRTVSQDFDHRDESTPLSKSHSCAAFEDPVDEDIVSSGSPSQASSPSSARTPAQKSTHSASKNILYRRLKLFMPPHSCFGSIGMSLQFVTMTEEDERNIERELLAAANSAESTEELEHIRLLRDHRDHNFIDIRFDQSSERDDWWRIVTEMLGARLLYDLRHGAAEDDIPHEKIMENNAKILSSQPPIDKFVEYFRSQVVDAVEVQPDGVVKQKDPSIPPFDGIIGVVFGPTVVKPRRVSIESKSIAYPDPDTGKTMRSGKEPHLVVAPCNVQQRLRMVPSFDMPLRLLSVTAQNEQWGNTFFLERRDPYEIHRALAQNRNIVVRRLVTKKESNVAASEGSGSAGSGSPSQVLSPTARGSNGHDFVADVPITNGSFANAGGSVELPVGTALPTGPDEVVLEEESFQRIELAAKSFVDRLKWLQWFQFILNKPVRFLVENDDGDRRTMVTDTADNDTERHGGTASFAWGRLTHSPTVKEKGGSTADRSLTAVVTTRDTSGCRSDSEDSRSTISELREDFPDDATARRTPVRTSSLIDSRISEKKRSTKSENEEQRNEGSDAPKVAATPEEMSCDVKAFETVMEYSDRHCGGTGSAASSADQGRDVVVQPHDSLNIPVEADNRLESTTVADDATVCRTSVEERHSSFASRSSDQHLKTVLRRGDSNKDVVSSRTASFMPSAQPMATGRRSSTSVIDFNAREPRQCISSAVAENESQKKMTQFGVMVSHDIAAQLENNVESELEEGDEGRVSTYAAPQLFAEAAPHESDGASSGEEFEEVESNAEACEAIWYCPRILLRHPGVAQYSDEELFGPTTITRNFSSPSFSPCKLSRWYECKLCVLQHPLAPACPLDVQKDRELSAAFAAYGCDVRKDLCLCVSSIDRARLLRRSLLFERMVIINKPIKPKPTAPVQSASNQASGTKEATALDEIIAKLSASRDAGASAGGSQVSLTPQRRERESSSITSAATHRVCVVELTLEGCRLQMLSPHRCLDPIDSLMAAVGLGGGLRGEVSDRKESLSTIEEILACCWTLGYPLEFRVVTDDIDDDDQQRDLDEGRVCLEYVDDLQGAMGLVKSLLPFL